MEGKLVEAGSHCSGPARGGGGRPVCAPQAEPRSDAQGEGVERRHQHQDARAEHGHVTG